MVIIETPIFTKLIVDLMPDDSYAKLQSELVERPDAGRVIRGTGGLRKIRWKLPGTGKRGGARVIYYWAVSEEKILMLFVFAKPDQEDLSHEQEQTLRAIVEEEFP